MAANGARPALAAHWRAGDAELEHLLADLTRDERIMAAEACGRDGARLGVTPGFPGEFSCGFIGSRVRPWDDVSGETWHAWTDVVALPGGRVQIDAIPMFNEGQAIGSLLLVHDLSFIERREETTQLFLIGAFALLAVAAAGVTVVAARSPGGTGATRSGAF
jgi:trehalose 6-phosphate synthase